MILECTSCKARFLVDPAQVGAGGRRVRCGRCRHEWWARASGDDLAHGLADPVEPAAPSGSNDIRPLPPGSNVPALRRPPRRWGEAIGWTLFVLAVAFLAGATFARDEMAARYPATRAVYQAFGFRLIDTGDGLQFADIVSAQRLEGGRAVVIVEGRVINASGDERIVPRLRATLYDESDLPVHAWTFTSAEARLGPGASTLFRTQSPTPQRPFARLSLTVVPPGK